jgi:disulfide bond formation protein DsbB
MPNPIAAKARLLLPHWPIIAFVLSALMLGAAHYAEKVDGLPPCILCLKQREAYWAALAIAGAAILSRLAPGRIRLERALNGLLALAFLYGMGVAIYHVGAEMKWWEGPKACAAGGSIGATSAQEIADMLAGKEVRVVSCEDPTYWPIPGFITMAMWNVLISLKLAIWSAAAALVRRPA